MLPVDEKICACCSVRSLRFSAEPKLIARPDRFAIGELNLDDLFAMHRSARFVGERGDDAFALDVKYFARRRPRVLAIQTEGNPAGLLAQLQAFDLFWRRDGIIEDVHHLVMAIAEPDLFLIRREADPV